MPRKKGWKKSLAVKTVRQKNTEKADVGLVPMDLGIVPTSGPLAVGIVPTAMTSVSAGVGFVPMDVGTVPTSVPLVVGNVPTAMTSVSAGVVTELSPVTVEADNVSVTTLANDFDNTLTNELENVKLANELENKVASELTTSNQLSNELPIEQSNDVTCEHFNQFQNDYEFHKSTHEILSSQNVHTATFFTQKTKYQFNASFLKFGSFDQFNERFPQEFRGSQCTCNALVFLLSCFIHDNPHLLNIDQVLIEGDQMYQYVIKNLKASGKFRSMLLTLNEIPDEVAFQNKRYRILKEEIQFGTAIRINSMLSFPTLQEAFVNSFQQSNLSLVMIGAICSAVYLNSDAFYFFDSHCHAHSALFDPLLTSGKSLVIGFCSLDDLVHYMYSFYTSMLIDLTSQFEVLPLHFTETVMPSIMNRILQNYFRDQEQRKYSPNTTDINLKKIPKKNVYMKEYMQKRRKNQTIKQKESDSIKLKRSDLEYRSAEQKKELSAKRKVRENKDLKQKEAVSKRLARNDPVYRSLERQRELVAKRKSRKDNEVKQKEAVSKRLARNDPVYRSLERQRELVAKTKSREDNEVKQKELVTKRKVRENKNVKQKEAVSKRLARNDSVYRSLERQRELVAKTKSREDNEVKQKEVLSKRLARNDPEYRSLERQRELAAKIKARENKDVQQKERDAKRKARNDEEVRIKERLCKQESRNKNKSGTRAYNKILKTRQRKNEIFALHENALRQQRKQGSCLEHCIEKFLKKISEGPTYICTSCHQTWFCDSVTNCTRFKQSVDQEMRICFTDKKSVNDIEWICHTCLDSIRKNKIPRLSVANKMGFPSKPIELNLYPLEERLISLRIPFMQIRQLPRGGQLSVRGNVVNVPVDVQPTINSLPHTVEKSGTIAVKLKKKLSYKKCDFSENVRPLAVICALHYLMHNSDMYKSSGVQMDQSWIKEITTSQQEETNNREISNDNDEANDADDSDHFSEIDENELCMGNTDTLLDEVIDESRINIESQFIFAPGEGQRPISLFSDDDAEYLSFPTIFCGQRRLHNKDRIVPVHYTDIVKWELRSEDRRVAHSVPNLFFKLKKIQLKNISDKVNLALRRCKSDGKKWTAKEILNPSTVSNIVKLDEGYYIFRTLRNSPVYLEKRKKDVFAMIRQLGLPTWFGSFSSADTNWKDLIRILGKLNDSKDYSDEEIEHMDWKDKSRLVQNDPVTCSRYFDFRVQQFIKLVLKSEHNPIGSLTDFFYRVEFQQRGSPHIHILIWIKDAPVFGQNSDKDIVEYIDRYVSCSLSPLSYSDLVKLQVHKHSKTCRKKGHPICRFGFPLPPMGKTVILEPLDQDIEKYKTVYKEIQTKIDCLHTSDNIDDMTFTEFLSEVLHLSEDEYLKAIRSNLSGAKVFVKRKPSEVRVNPYMKTLLPAWRANHDLQFVLDPYACAVYIVSYISKSQKGMSALLDQAAKEAREGNLDLKRQVRHIGNYFTNAVETSAQEAVYLTLQIPLTKATRQVVFINTSPPDQRTFLLKQHSELEKLSPDSTDIESSNDIKRYLRRPKQLENWCLADYISQLEVKFPGNYNEAEGKEPESDEDSETDDNQSNEEEENAKILKITLKNGIVIRQRKSSRVIRYVRYNKKTDPENFFRERLFLFFPWRNEQTDLKGDYNTYEQMYNTIYRTVECKAKQFEHNAEELDKALEQAENDCDQFDELAPGTQQVEQEDVEQGSTEAEQYIHFNPDRPSEHRQYDISEEVGVSARTVELTNHANRISNCDYFNLIRSLNKKQREFFQHVVTWFKTKNDPLYAFLTGGAGVGKSVVVKAIFQALHRYFCCTEGENPDDIRILLCAPTGKAAYNINGLTIHNAFQIQPNKGLDQTLSCDVLNTLRMKYRNLTVVMIDEISMVGNKMFSLLESRLKKIKGNNQAFGGVSIIAIGDFFQLKPVFDGWIFEDLTKGLSALAPNLWRELFRVHELTQIMRQKDDLDFANLLNRLRQNNLTQQDIEVLNTRIVTVDDPTYKRDGIHLFTQNVLVDKFNYQYISKLSSEKVTVKAVDSVVGDLLSSVKSKLISSLPDKQSDTANLAKEVELAVGMKYDLTANIDVNDGLTNGSSCQLKLFEYKTASSRPSIVWVKFDHMEIGTNTRKKYSHLYSRNVDKSWTPVFDIKRSFTYRYKNFERIQIPLRPAAGKTIHKSQGDTMTEVVVNMESKCKAKIPHIYYVALSRVTSLSGLQILNRFDSNKIAVSDSVKEEVERLKSDAPLALCFKPLYTLPAGSFKVVFNNVRSLHAHFQDIKADPNIIDADVIGFAETRLLATDKQKDYMLPGFAAPIRLDQTSSGPNRPYHGLVLYHRNDCILHSTQAYSTPLLEFVLADIISETKGLYQVVFVYKAPQMMLGNLKQVLISNLLPLLDLSHPKIIIMGDFNLDLLNCGNSAFLDFMSRTFNCSQLVTESTTSYQSLLDLIFINIYPVMHIEVDILNAYWTDHKVIYAAVHP